MSRFRIGKAKWVLRARRLSGSDRAISTIMANLTMLIIVVFLSTLLFTWSIASFGAYQTGAGYWFGNRSLANQERIAVENAFFYTIGSSSYVKIYVRNVGTIQLTLANVYINGTLYQFTQQGLPVNNVTLVGSPITGTGLCMSCNRQSFVRGDLQTIRVVTLRGTVLQTQWVA